MLIDLHTHSTASDGTDSPAALVKAAWEARLDVVALTDHDTTVGWVEAAAAVPAGLTLVPEARRVFDLVKGEWMCQYDDAGAMVRRASSG